MFRLASRQLPSLTANLMTQTDNATPPRLDLSPQGLHELHEEIERAIRKGLIKPNFQQHARMAVADGIRAGLVKPPPRSSTAAAGNLEASTPPPAPRG